jgi:adenylate cyclase
MRSVQRLVAATLIAIAVSALVLALRATPTLKIPIERLDSTLYDSLYRSRPIQNMQDADVVIVAVDDRSMDDINREYKKGWPWPRKYWGSITEFLAEDCHARAVVFDLTFNQRSSNPDKPEEDDDALFAEAIARARREGTAAIVFGQIVNPDGSYRPFAPPVNPPSAFGAVNVSEAEEWREYSPEVFRRPSLAAQTLQSAGLKPKLPLDRSFLLHFYGPHQDRRHRQTFRYVNAANVAFVAFGAEPSAAHIDPAIFRDKIVLIGGIALGTYDEKATPLSAKVPGVEIQATAIENLLRGDQVHPLGFAPTAGATFAAAWLAALAVVYPHRAWLKLIAALLAIALLLLVATTLFLKHDIVWLPLAAPLVAATLTTIGAFAWSYLGEDRQRRRLLKALSSVVSPHIAEELARDPSKLSIGGQRREMTVMFSDIAGFTDLSETLPPEKLAPLLNFYLEEMSGIVLDQSGTLDKYIGDAIMSFWNAPLAQPDHAALACRAALRMVARETAIQPALKELGAARILTRIGINSGPMAVGFTGSSHLINYTVLGDSVNLGSRLEGANKLYATRVMLSETTAALVKDRFTLRQLDVLRVKGKLKPMAVYELIAEGPTDESTARRVRLYESALHHYQQQRWNDAEKLLLEMAADFPDDGPAKALAFRIAHYRHDPPPAGWDGVYVAKEK